MKKKGFTLVELLAVIAILAILVILVVPRVIQLFEGSQDGLFRRDAQSIFKAVTNDVLSSSVAQKGKKLDIVYRKDFNDSTPCSVGGSVHTLGEFDLEGIKDLAYYIQVDRNRVVNFIVCSSAYCVQMDTSSASHTVNGQTITNAYKGLEELDLGYISEVAISNNVQEPMAAVKALNDDCAN